MIGSLTKLVSPDTPSCSQEREKAASAPTLGQVRKARNETHTDATEAQRDAGNYKKGSIPFHGLTIKIENPKDSYRRGKDANGKAWETRMTADYGYFASTMAIDGDAIDAFVGPKLDSELVVAVDQYKPDGSFDETKFIVGVDSKEAGEKLYLSNYQKGWKLGPTATCTIWQLKNWIKNGAHKKPFVGQLVKAAKLAAIIKRTSRL